MQQSLAVLTVACSFGLADEIITRNSSGALAIVVTVALLVPALVFGAPGNARDFAGIYWPTAAGRSSCTVTGTAPPWSAWP